MVRDSKQERHLRGQDAHARRGAERSAGARARNDRRGRGPRRPEDQAGGRVGEVLGYAGIDKVARAATRAAYRRNPGRAWLRQGRARALARGGRNQVARHPAAARGSPRCPRPRITVKITLAHSRPRVSGAPPTIPFVSGAPKVHGSPPSTAARSWTRAVAPWW